jgi:hypothetical protein
MWLNFRNASTHRNVFNASDPTLLSFGGVPESKIKKPRNCGNSTSEMTNKYNFKMYADRKMIIGRSYF